MGLRFRKRINILPGVKLNFSKSGISTTIGGKGGSININKNGVYGNAGIPGTGIYVREKISGNKSCESKTIKNSNVLIHTQQELSDVPREQVEQTSEKGALLGCSIVLVSFIVGLFVGVKYGNLFLAITIAIVPFLIMLLLNKNEHTSK